MVEMARHSLVGIVLIDMFCQRSSLFHVLIRALSKLMQKGSTRYKMVQTQEVNFAYIGQLCLIGLISLLRALASLSTRADMMWAISTLTTLHGCWRCSVDLQQPEEQQPTVAYRKDRNTRSDDVTCLSHSGRETTDRFRGFQLCRLVQARHSDMKNFNFLGIIWRNYFWFFSENLKNKLLQRT